MSKTTPETEARIVHKTDISKIKEGDIMAFLHYVKVDKVFLDRQALHVVNLDGVQEKIEYRGKEMIEANFSADQYAEEIKTTKTAAAEILVSSHSRPFTVAFDKADGTERILRGRLVKHEPLMGRSMVEDLDTTDKNRVRLVDHRSIKYIIVEGVRYTVK